MVEELIAAHLDVISQVDTGVFMDTAWLPDALHATDIWVLCGKGQDSVFQQHFQMNLPEF